MKKLDLFDLFAKITLDTSEYESGLDDAREKTSSFADTLKNGLASAAKVGAAALTAASAGVVALTKNSIDQYAEYEQLVGGVDTLFKEASDTIQQYAANAFQTAGMSANEYMSTVTNFSASLIQSLEGDTAAAAELSNRAITDMADNANKMGTSLQSLQDAYRGFSRQNYTMLDNLALGYGGTQEEMQRLLDDAEELSGVHYELGNFGDMIEAIHVVQEEMGITGTTAAEASSTISGSVASAQSAWANLATGIADENADLDTLIGQFVDSVETAAGNIIPRVVQILSGLGSAIEQLAPILAEEVPKLITSVLPSLVSAGAQLLVGLVTGLIGALPDLIAAVPTIIQSIVTAISDNLPAIAAAGSELLHMFTSGAEQAVPAFISSLPSIINGFLDYITSRLPDILNKGVEMINYLVNGILDTVPQMVAQLPAIITAFIEFIADNIPTILDAGANILINLVTGLIEAIPELIASLPEIISALTDGLADAAPKIISAGFNIIKKLIEGIISAVPELVASLPEIVNAIITGIGNLMSGIVEIGANIVRGIWDGIVGMGQWLIDQVTGFFGGIVDGVKNFLGIKSPSRVFAGIGENMALGLGEGWDNEYGRIRRDIESGMDFGTANVDFASSGLGVASAGMINGISSAVQSGGGTYSFNLIMPDGARLASYTFQPMVDYAKANGTPILNPT